MLISTWVEGATVVNHPQPEAIVDTNGAAHANVTKVARDGPGRCYRVGIGGARQMGGRKTHGSKMKSLLEDGQTSSLRAVFVSKTNQLTVTPPQVKDQVKTPANVTRIQPR